jgi:hypothetical protein
MPGKKEYVSEMESNVPFCCQIAAAGEDDLSDVCLVGKRKVLSVSTCEALPGVHLVSTDS